MQKINQVTEKSFGNLPTRVLQIGEGVFLRAFADWTVESCNRRGIFNSSVVIAQPRGVEKARALNGQDCIYTLVTRGLENGEKVERFDRITSVRRALSFSENPDELIELACSKDLEVIISNTTEAGIAYHAGDRFEDEPPVSYPARLCVLLYKRFERGLDGLMILPCELIDNNGGRLLEYVLRYAEEWRLGADFCGWLKENCCFASTLVDRIVTGFPANDAAALCESLGYEDAFIDACEPFYLWVIECPKEWEERLPFDKSGLNVVFTRNAAPYKTRKVRILNGAHTVSVLAAYLSGFETVGEMVADEVFLKFICKAVFDEIIPTVDLTRAELETFANSVLERFANPFIRHRLLDISLNSVSKYRARCLPSLKDSLEITGRLPSVLCFGLAALIAFYGGEMTGQGYFGRRGSGEYQIRDDAEVLEFMNEACKKENKAELILGNADFWGENLDLIPGLTELIEKYTESIEKQGMKKAVEDLCRAL